MNVAKINTNENIKIHKLHSSPMKKLIKISPDNVYDNFKNRSINNKKALKPLAFMSLLFLTIANKISAKKAEVKDNEQFRYLQVKDKQIREIDSLMKQHKPRTKGSAQIGLGLWADTLQSKLVDSDGRSLFIIPTSKEDDSAILKFVYDCAKKSKPIAVHNINSLGIESSGEVMDARRLAHNLKTYLEA